MKFSIKDCFSKRDQILRKLRIWSYLMKKSFMENLRYEIVLLSVVKSYKTLISERVTDGHFSDFQCGFKSSRSSEDLRLY